MFYEKDKREALLELNDQESLMKDLALKKESRESTVVVA